MILGPVDDGASKNSRRRPVSCHGPLKSRNRQGDLGLSSHVRRRESLGITSRIGMWSGRWYIARSNNATRLTVRGWLSRAAALEELDPHPEVIEPQ